jgi:NitT/TauT family transport system ATP-binding protein
MDEPFGALDAITKAGLQDQVRAIKAETQATFAFVTHDVDEAVYLGDRALVLAGSPAVLADDVMIDLGNRREQVATRASDSFLRLRARLHDALGHE